MIRVRSAAKELEAAIDHVRKAQRLLFETNSDQRFRVTMVLADIKEIRAQLTDPKFTTDTLTRR